MTRLIQGGMVIDPANQVMSKLNILISGGKIAKISSEPMQADSVIDATGKIVCPGFVDIHLHEDPLEADGKIYSDEEKAIFNCMLRMGVTTAVGGNCGQNCCDPGDYLDLVDRDGAAINVLMLAGHEYFREQAGALDKYAPSSAEQRRKMAEGISKALDRGCAGVSYGIRYIPGIDMQELIETAAACKRNSKLIAAHLRSDAQEIFAAAQEFLNTGRDLGIPVQISHIGSMAGFGQMERFLAMLDEYKLNGLDISCDCYPYNAFSTTIGSTTYDEGWLDRYGCGYDVIELCEGKYKGERCTKESFEEMRRDMPGCITSCFVMRDEDVDLAFKHANVMLASDGIFNHGQGHPRASGSFPRFIAQYVNSGKLTMYDAINRMTAMPAKRLRLENKGRINAGADADIVIFDPIKIKDNASFAEPAVAPSGIDYVLIGGEIAAKDAKIIEHKLGKSVRV